MSLDLLISIVCYFFIYSIMFGFSIGLTAISLIVERKEGLIDRTWVAGVNVTEIIFAQILTQFFVLLVQITLLVTVVVFGYKVCVHKRVYVHKRVCVHKRICLCIYMLLHKRVYTVCTEDMFMHVHKRMCVHKRVYTICT